MTHRILVVDDEVDWIDTYRDWLEPDGFEVRGATGIERAMAEAISWDPHVILVDQKLEGAGGRDLGLSLIGRLAGQNPAARIFLVTAFATKEAVIQAFANGGADYLEKGPILEPLLRKKVAAAAELASKALDDQGREARETELREVWRRAQTEKGSQLKGKLLERAVRLVFESVPGLRHAATNARNETEEIDVLVMNRSTDPLLSRQGDFFVVECKNWSGVVGTEVISRLREKVAKRYGRSKIGVCVALGGFAGTVHTDLLAERRGELLILLIDREGLQAWIDTDDREGWLRSRIEAVVVEG